MSKPPKPDLKALIAADVAPAVKDAAASMVAEELPVATVEPAPVPPAPVVTVAAAPAPVALHTRRPAPSRRQAPPKAEGRGTIRERARQLSLYLEDPVYDQIREIAHVERVKMHQLVLEGIDLLLKKRGAPSIKELMKQAS
jgi:hypothetical protein